MIRAAFSRGFGIRNSGVASRGLRASSVDIRSIPGMAGRFDAVESRIADVEIFPAYRIMQRLGAGVAPVAVEIVLAERRARAAEFVQVVGGEDGDFAGKHVGLGDLDGSLGDIVIGR